MGKITKGFITLAVGDYYCKLATHLFMSYKLFGNSEYPFYVITDEDGKKKLGNLFDGVIVKSGFTKTWVDKLAIFTDTPFDETIFIDADSSIVSDINYLFEKFEENGSDISGISRIKQLEKGEKGIQFGLAAIDELGLTYDFPKFNGGVYYYRKSELGRRAVDFMMQTVLPNYHEWGLLSGNKNEVYDEPVVIVTMIKFGMKTIPLETNAMYLVQNAKKVKWNLRKRKSSFKWYDKKVSPTIIHWKVGGTETYNYEKYDAKVKGIYYKRSFFVVKKRQVLSFVKFYIYPKLLKVFPKLRNTAKKYKD